MFGCLWLEKKKSTVFIFDNGGWLVVYLMFIFVENFFDLICLILIPF